MARRSHPTPAAPPIQVGRTGYKQFGGFTREEWHQDLVGSNGVKVYREMADNHPVIGAWLWSQEAMIRRIPLKVVRPNDTPAARRAEDHIESCFEDMRQSWMESVSGYLSMLIFGYCPAEIVYKIRRGKQPEDGELRTSKFNDGLWGWDTIAVRSQESTFRWEYNAEGDAIGLWQLPPPDYRLRYIDGSRLLNFRPRMWKAGPEGRSLLRPAYVPYRYQKRIAEFEGIGVQRDLAGLPIVKGPVEIFSAGASDDEKATLAKLEAMAPRIERNQYEGLVFPSDKLRDGSDSGYSIELLSTGGSRQYDTDKINQRLNSQIAIALLAQQQILGTDPDEAGSRALSDNHLSLAVLGTAAILQSILEPFNSKAVPDLCTLNMFPPETWPRIEHGDIERPSLAEIGTFLQQVGGIPAGAAGPALRVDPWMQTLIRSLLPGGDRLPELEAIDPDRQADQIPSAPDSDPISSGLLPTPGQMPAPGAVG